MISAQRCSIYKLCCVHILCVGASLIIGHLIGLRQHKTCHSVRMLNQPTNERKNEMYQTNTTDFYDHVALIIQYFHNGVAAAAIHLMYYHRERKKKHSHTNSRMYQKRRSDNISRHLSSLIGHHFQLNSKWCWRPAKVCIGLYSDCNEVVWRTFISSHSNGDRPYQRKKKNISFSYAQTTKNFMNVLLRRQRFNFMLHAFQSGFFRKKSGPQRNLFTKMVIAIEKECRKTVRLEKEKKKLVEEKSEHRPNYAQM